MMFNSLWLPLSSIGLGGAVTYFLSTAKYSVSETWAAMSAVGFLQGGLIAIIAQQLYGAQLLGQVGSSIPFDIFSITMITLPLQGIHSFGSRILLGDSRYRLANIFTILAAVLPPLVQTITIIAIPRFLLDVPHPARHFLLSQAVLGHSISILLQTVAIVSVLWIQYGGVRWFPAGFLRESFGYGAKIWWADITARLNLRGDQWILGMRSGSSQLAYYGIAVTISELVCLIPDAINQVLFNRLAAQSADEQRRELVERIHRLLVWVALIQCVVACILAPVIIPVVFGERYRPTIGVLVLLLPGAICLTSMKVLTKYFAASGLPGLSSISTMAGTIIGLGTCWIVLWEYPELGATGAAITASFGYFAGAAVGGYLFFGNRRITQEMWALIRYNRSDWVWAIGQIRYSINPPRNVIMTDKESR